MAAGTPQPIRGKEHKVSEERSKETPEVDETFADDEATPAAGTGEPGGAADEEIDTDAAEERGNE